MPRDTPSVMVHPKLARPASREAAAIIDTQGPTRSPGFKLPVGNAEPDPRLRILLTRLY